MIVAGLLVVLGVAFSIAAVHLAGVRLAGVLVVPLAAVYALYEFVMLPVFVVSVAVAYLTIVALRRWTLLFGRSLLLGGIFAGALVPLVALAALKPTGPVEVAFLGSILPGVAAYNFSREDRSVRRLDAIASVGALCSLFVTGFALVNPTTATLIGNLAPPLLFAEWSDVATFRRAAVPTAEYAPVVPRTVATLGFVAGIAANEAVYARWGVRLVGMVAVPLLAVFTLGNPVVLPLYVVGLLAAFAVVRAIAWRTLVYGRVLLSIAIGAGIVLTVPVAVVGPSVPGFVLLFVGILSGIGAYNVHRIPPAERTATLWFSGAAFVAFVAVFWAFAWDPASTPGLPHVVLGLGVVVGAVRKAVDLEGQIIRRNLSATRGIEP